MPSCRCTQAGVTLWKSEDKMQEPILPFGMWGPEIRFESPGLMASAFLTESSHWPLILCESNILGLLESSILTFNFSTSSHFQHYTGLSWWLPLALSHRFPFAPQSSWLPCLWSKSFSCVKWECQNKFSSTHKASQRPSAQSSGIHYHLNICFLTRYFWRDPGQATSSILISFSPPHWTLKLS